MTGVQTCALPIYWDYITIGSNGFAQVGRPEYWEKQLAEKAVLMKHMADIHPVPEILQHLCYYAWKSFEHEFGTYHELVLCYDRYFLDHLDEDSPEEDYELEGKFWEFAHACERESLETDMLTGAIKEYYSEYFFQDIEVIPVQYPETLAPTDYFIDSLDVLEVSEEKATLIRKIHSGLLDSATFDSCKRWIDQCYHRPSDEELRMCAFNEILEGYGIEAHFGEWQNGYWCDVEFTYVNMGDSYALTIIRHRDKGWLVGTVGDLVEVAG